MTERHSTERLISSGETLRQAIKVKVRKRRNDVADLMDSAPSKFRNDLLPKLDLVYLAPSSLKAPSRNVRKIIPAHVRRVMNSIAAFGFIAPVLIDHDKNILDGVVATEAAVQLNLETIPCICAKHLSASEMRVVRLALNRLGEKGKWALPDLRTELLELADEGIEIADTAFTLPEFDAITLDDEVEAVEKGPFVPDGPPVARLGDTFILDGVHRVLCGDATEPGCYRNLFKEATARLVLTDEPYNVPIAGHVTKGAHSEFVMASGEMSDGEFGAFNVAWVGAAMAHLCDGGLIGTFIDWRGLPIVHAAATGHGLVPINLCVWNKSNAGMGSLYRSQHELFPLYKKGTAGHVNNIELGRNGRWRSNVWCYPGASSVSSDSRKGLEFHPTVKPVAMLTDAILDLSDRADIVLDPFLGSGSTLIAAHGVGRQCFGIERDARYVDVILKRCRTVCGLSAVLETTGESYEDLAQRRSDETLAG